MPQGSIFSFEPNPELYEDLRFNIRVNGAERITPLNIALSDETGTFTLCHNPDHTGAAVLMSTTPSSAPPPQAIQHVILAVAPKNLGVVLEEARRRRVCIKIDVEGHEFAVLRGLREAGLLAHAAWVIVEIDAAYLARFGASVMALYQLMEEEGFSPEKSRNFADHYDEIFVRLSS